MSDAAARAAPVVRAVATAAIEFADIEVAALAVAAAGTRGPIATEAVLNITET